MDSLKKKDQAGYFSSLKLALYFFTFFGLLSTGLFVIAYFSISKALQEKELRYVRNKALEYKAWFQKGDLASLENRLNQQVVDPDDVIFVHVNGTGIDYVNITNLDQKLIPSDDFHQFDTLIEGSNITIAGQKWTVASVPVGENNLVLQAGKNSAGIDETLRKFRYSFLLLFLPGSLLAIVGGTLLTYRLFLPIRRLIKTTTDILESGDLKKEASADKKGNELNSLVTLFNRLLRKNRKLITGMQESLDHVAHDIRTPLNRIKNTAEHGLSPKRSPEEVKSALSDCAEEIEYIEQLLNVLMNVAEAEAGAIRLKREPVNIHNLLEDVSEIYELVADDKQISLSISCVKNTTALLDRTRIAQALANLLDNAIKYSPEGSHVTLSSTHDNSTLQFSVIDQGIGIPPQHLNHIWDRLYRADSSRNTPGMGLGLSLVKGIAEAHGGTVSAESQPGSGTTITLSFPLIKQTSFPTQQSSKNN